MSNHLLLMRYMSMINNYTMEGFSFMGIKQGFSWKEGKMKHEWRRNEGWVKSCRGMVSHCRMRWLIVKDGMSLFWANFEQQSWVWPTFFWLLSSSEELDDSSALEGIVSKSSLSIDRRRRWAQPEWINYYGLHYQPPIYYEYSLGRQECFTEREKQWAFK